MNSDTLIEVSLSRISDLSERCQYLRSKGRTEEADLLYQEGAMIARALDNNDTFLVMCLPEGFSV